MCGTMTPAWLCRFLDKRKRQALPSLKPKSAASTGSLAGSFDRFSNLEFQAGVHLPAAMLVPIPVFPGHPEV